MRWVILLLSCLDTFAASVTLAWDAPNTSESTGVTEYTIYYGNSSRVYTAHESAGLTLSKTISGLPDGFRYYFAVTARNSIGESDYSNEISWRSPSTNPPIYMVIQAESSVVREPMVRIQSDLAMGGFYVMSTNTDQGYCVMPFTVPFSDDYVVWARVLCPNDGMDSFVVSYNGTNNDVYDCAKEYSLQWQWTLVNGRGGIIKPYTDAFAIDPRIFPFMQGTNAINFQGRETGTKLDAIVVTNNRELVPNSPDTPMDLQLTVEQ